MRVCFSLEWRITCQSDRGDGERERGREGERERGREGGREARKRRDRDLILLICKYLSQIEPTYYNYTEFLKSQLQKGSHAN